ncbi:transforming growth factor beta regulator 1 [Leguminivora glycinivorella]|uniref:transforming growth factor beta regulator 1 n=1 Tax=Leguminivora glycinivorella TaxID=1035111 RepID=UPI00200E56CF|nr:transforming growth factor beta regulator 1 [Leguminivora glycinivorella]
MNNVLNEKQNNSYRKKYKFMKRRIKSLILENAALCDEVAKIQESIIIVKDERKFLLRKLLEYVNEAEFSQQNYRHDTTTMANGPSAKLKKRKSLEDNSRSISIS